MCVPHLKLDTRRSQYMQHMITAFFIWHASIFSGRDGSVSAVYWKTSSTPIFEASKAIPLR